MRKNRAVKASAAIGGILLLLAPLMAADRIDPRGKPDVKNFEGYKVWKGEKSWRIEMAAGSKKLDFSGKISCEGAGRIKSVYLVENGKRKPYGNWNDRLVKVSTPLKSAVKGLTFNATCKRLKFDLMEDKNRKPGFIIIGKGGKSPANVPFALMVE